MLDADQGPLGAEQHQLGAIDQGVAAEELRKAQIVADAQAGCAPGEFYRGRRVALAQPLVLIKEAEEVDLAIDAA